MTEEDAKEKWCPFSRAVSATRQHGQTGISSGQAAFNRMEFAKEPNTLAAYPGATRCIGSACMAFRWMVTPGTAARFATAKLENPRSEGPSENSGYCGLAGAPQ